MTSMQVVYVEIGVHAVGQSPAGVPAAMRAPRGEGAAAPPAVAEPLDAGQLHGCAERQHARAAPAGGRRERGADAAGGGHHV